MPAKQIQSRSSPFSTSKDVEPGQISHSYGDGHFAAVTLRGRPVDKSKTGRTCATIFVYAINLTDWAVCLSLTINVVFYAIVYLHQDISNGAMIATNYTGSYFLLPVLAGFLSDSFLGHYATIILGAVIEIMGLAVLVLSATYDGLQPPACTPTLTSACPPAGGKYTGALLTALYTVALGTSMIKASLAPFGGEQFDEANEVEQQESVHYFKWYYFSQEIGAFFAVSFTVWILNYKSKAWGFGSLIPVSVLGLGIFLAGTPKFRHKKPGGSFMTRFVQVIVAAFRKRRLAVPEDDGRLHDEPVSGGWLKRSDKLRFLDKAGIIEENHPTESRWQLPGITQIEEAKRICQLMPVWASTCLISVIFAQVVTFTATQGQTLDRKLGRHFVLPPQSLALALIVSSCVMVPIYDKIMMPLCKKITGNSYGISPLKACGLGIFCAVLAMVSAALVEKKRLGYIRHRGYTQLPTFDLPMTMWWLFPQYFFSGATELFLFVSLYEFYYHEVSNGTRSIAVSFLFSSLSLGYFLSSVLVNVTNRVTKHHHGGQWLKARLNNGGLENYFWLLTIMLSVNFIFFVIAAYFYDYNYPLFRSQTKNPARGVPGAEAENEGEREKEREVELQSS